MNEKIVLGVLQGAHGVNGLVKMKWYTGRAEGLSAYGPVTLSGGKVYNIALKFVNNKYAICVLDGIKTKEQAELLKGKEVSVERAELPKLNKGEFYEVDLVGCVVEDLKGKKIGVVSAIHNFGAGPLVEIGDELIRFDGYNFPSVNTGKKRIVRKI